MLTRSPISAGISEPIRRPEGGPTWVAKASGGVRATLDADFARGRYWFNGKTYTPHSDFLTAIGGTFARTSEATYFDSDGILQTAASGELRFDHDPVTNAARGILLEGERDNKCTNLNASPDVGLTNVSTLLGDGNTTLTRADKTAELAAAGLNGNSMNANVVHLNNLTASAAAYVKVTGIATNTNPHVLSVYVLGDGQLHTGFQAGPVFSNAAFEREVFVTSGTSVDEEWRILVAAGDEVFFVLNVFEEASFVSSPIVTAGSAATRAADSYTIGPTGGVPFTGWSASEGATIVSGSFPVVSGNNSDPRLFEFSDGATTNRIRLDRDQGTDLRMLGVDGGATVVNEVATWTLSDGEQYTAALAWVLNDWVTVLDGAVFLTANAGTIPSPDELHVGFNHDASDNPLFGHISRLTYFPSRISNADLVSLTS